MYCTQQDLIIRFGQKEINGLLKELADSEGSADLSMKAAIEDACGEIDGYLSNVWDFKNNGIPNSKLLTAWACDIARYRLWCNADRQQVKEAVIIRYQNVIKMLEMLGKSITTLPMTTESGDIINTSLNYGDVSCSFSSRIFSLDGSCGTDRKDFGCSS